MSRTRHLRTIVIQGLVLALVLSASCSAREEAGGPDEKAVVQACNTTAIQLYGGLKKDSENLVISPFSIGTAMSMALSGARGDTEKEMMKVLNQTVPRERMDSAHSKILARLNRFEKGKDVVLSTANALCLTVDSALVHKDYRTLLSTKYNAEIFDAHNVGPINAWVAKKTHGKIDKILEKLSANSVCVLLNAIYFKGLWASQFDKKLTRPGEFFTTEGKTLSVPMMHQTAEFSVATRDGCMAVALPYKVDSLAMVVILPTERKGLPGIEKQLSAAFVQAVLDDLGKHHPTKVALSLPRFKIEFGADLIPAFQSEGMKLAFSAEKADFGGITGRDTSLGLIWIAQIKHKAFLEVNEEGSEAAAATAVELQTKSVPRITRFLADHPFLFLLVDKATNAILFMGCVNDPLEGA